MIRRDIDDLFGLMLKSPTGSTVLLYAEMKGDPAPRPSLIIRESPEFIRRLQAVEKFEVDLGSAAVRFTPDSIPIGIIFVTFHIPDEDPAPRTFAAFTDPLGLIEGPGGGFLEDLDSQGFLPVIFFTGRDSQFVFRIKLYRRFCALLRPTAKKARAGGYPAYSQDEFVAQVQDFITNFANANELREYVTGTTQKGFAKNEVQNPRGYLN